MRRTHHGSCHCGAVRFEADFDLMAGTSKCNCSICMKARFWKAIVPAGDFRLPQGEDVLTEYRFGPNIRHYFCSRCGVKPFGRGHIEGFGDFVAVNVVALDDAADEELAEAPVEFQNGRENAWESAPAETRYL